MSDIVKLSCYVEEYKNEKENIWLNDPPKMVYCST